MSEWMPIESAPRDFGVTLFDVWNGDRVADCWWGTPTYGPAIFGVVYRASYDCNGPVNEYVNKPSHWMLLPEPPKE